MARPIRLGEQEIDDAEYIFHADAAPWTDPKQEHFGMHEAIRKVDEEYLFEEWEAHLEVAKKHEHIRKRLLGKLRPFQYMRDGLLEAV